jgi:voltage-gated potassium channel
MKTILKKSIHFLKLIYSLLTSVPFITLSILGNIVVFAFAGLLFLLEGGINPGVKNFMDALWWSFQTATTVGFGDIVPVTVYGKAIGILLMLVGVALFSIYTALFARAILDDPDYLN